MTNPSTMQRGAGPTLRAARPSDAAFFALIVKQVGGSTHRLGRIDVADPAAVAEAMWRDTAAVLIAELDARPLAVSTVYRFDVVHGTAWLDLLAADLSRPATHAIVRGVVHLAFRAWPLRTIRTAEPRDAEPILAGFGRRVRHEGVVPGRCPGAGNGDAVVRAIWRDDLPVVRRDGRHGRG